MKKILLIVVSILILSAVGYFWYQNNQGSTLSPEVTEALEGLDDEIGNLEYSEANTMFEKLAENEIPMCEEGSAILGEDVESSDIFSADYAVEGNIVEVCIELNEEEQASVQVVVTDEESNESTTHGIVVYDPSEVFSAAFDAQRNAHMAAIAMAMKIKAVDEGEIGADSEGDVIPECSSKIGLGTGQGAFDPEVTPTYLVSMPVDPEVGTEENSGYYVCSLGEGEYRVTGATLE